MLLGNEDHGRWLLAPAAEIRSVRRRYREGTLVLETDYETADGAVTLIDCMPPRSREPDLVRMVVGRRGQVRMRMQLIIRFDYGSIVPWVRRTDKGIRAVAGPDTLILHSGVDVRGENFRTEAEFTVSEGQRVPFVLMWHPSHEPAQCELKLLCGSARYNHRSCLTKLACRLLIYIGILPMLPTKQYQQFKKLLGEEEKETNYVT